MALVAVARRGGAGVPLVRRPPPPLPVMVMLAEPAPTAAAEVPRAVARVAGRPAVARDLTRVPETIDILQPTREPTEAAARHARGDGDGGTIRSPAFVTGRLWERALPGVPSVTASRYAKTHPELIDSAVTAMMRTYLDSLAAESGFRAEARPDWTTTIAGKTFGFEGPYVVLAGLKLPAAILGLLPLSGGPSPEQARRAQQLLDMRDEIWRAAAQAETYHDFRSSVKSIRERVEADREFQRNQRLPMPPLAADTTKP